METEIKPEPKLIPPVAEIIEMTEKEFSVKLDTDGRWWLGPVEGNG